MPPKFMNRFPAIRLFFVAVMLLGMAGGPAGAFRAPGSCCVEGARTMACCHMASCHMACCAAKKGEPAQEKPAPVQQRVGQELAAAVTATPFSLLFTFGPTEVRRAPRALFADGHSPEPLAASCIRLI